MTAMDVPGGDVFVKNNPPPILDTITRFYVEHFMKLLSVENLSVLHIMEYVKELGITETELFIEVMLKANVKFKNLLEKQRKKQTKTKT